MVEKLADKVMELQSNENINIPFLKKQLANTQKSIDNIIRAIEQGVLTSSTKIRLDELEDLKSNLEIRLIQEEMQKPLLTKEQVLFWIHKFRKFDLMQFDHKQRLIDSFINAIYLYDDKIVITFNYKENSRTITLDEINSSDIDEFGVPEHGSFRERKNKKEKRRIKVSADADDKKPCSVFFFLIFYFFFFLLLSIHY